MQKNILFAFKLINIFLLNFYWGGLKNFDKIKNTKIKSIFLSFGVGKKFGFMTFFISNK